MSEKANIILLDHMGSDAEIVEAARVSYRKGTKTVSEDRGLIRYLMKHRHTTPFEMCELKFFVRAPIFVARQWMRHRTASINEVSGRYSDMPMEGYTPSEWRRQSTTNAQGSEGSSTVPVENDLYRTSVGISWKCYYYLLLAGVAREQARTVLPLGTFTEWYWKIDLHNLLHFLSLRLGVGAQEEIREYAVEIAAVVERLFPLTWEAFVDYRLESMTLSRMEVEALYDNDNGLDCMSKRERDDFKSKKERLGL